MSAVLVVDDDEEIREGIADLLRDWGYAVAVAADGAEALGWLKAHPSPDLVLLDLMMPMMNGQEMKAKMDEDARLANIPVVIISASGDAARIAADLHAAALVHKPFDIDVLRETIERWSRHVQ